MIDSKQVVERYVAAVAAGDEQAIRDSFAEDATWWLGGDLPISGTWNGREAIMGDFLGHRDGLLRARLGQPRGHRAWSPRATG